MEKYHIFTGLSVRREFYFKVLSWITSLGLHPEGSTSMNSKTRNTNNLLHSKPKNTAQ